MVNTGDTAGIPIGASLVLLTTPGLARFYGGMVRARSVLDMVLWVLYGCSMAVGDDVGAGLRGDPGHYLGVEDLMADVTGVDGGLPVMAFVGFQAVVVGVWAPTTSSESS